MNITEKELEEMQSEQRRGMEPNEVVKTFDRMDRILADLWELFRSENPSSRDK
jgi:hypothetical protein